MAEHPDTPVAMAPPAVYAWLLLSVLPAVVAGMPNSERVRVPGMPEAFYFGVPGEVETLVDSLNPFRSTDMTNAPDVATSIQMMEVGIRAMLE